MTVIQSVVPLNIHIPIFNFGEITWSKLRVMISSVECSRAEIIY